MLHPSHEEFIGDRLDARIPNYFNTDVEDDKILQRLVTSSSFMALTSTFVRGKMDNSMRNKEYRTALGMKELADTVESCNDRSESLPSR